MKTKSICFKKYACVILTLAWVLCSGFAFGAELGVPEDYETIQTAIDAANAGDTVVVADGTYTGTGNKELDFGGKPIIVQSENGPDNCVIDCENDGRGVYFHSGERGDSVLSGFTIVNGNAYYGGGIFCDDKSSPTIANCIVSGNTADYGGGICCYDSSSPTIANCAVSGNTADYGGGIFCEISSSPTIANCAVSGNTADYGGGICCYHSSSPTIANCAVSGNLADYGGGICCCYSSSPTIANCTVSGNLADYGGGIFYSDSSSVITNSIFWGDTPDEIFRYDFASNPAMIYSDIQGGYEGEGNIDTDPLFQDAGSGDYRLTADSPCIDAGRATGTSGKYLPRAQGRGIDMGAYEYMNHKCKPKQR